MSGFTVGDRVRWVSQSQGYKREKRGEVVEVVPAGEHPSRVIRGRVEQDYNPTIIWSSAAYSLPRNKRSYVVAVPTASGRGRAKLYWPVVSLLQPDAQP